MLIRYYLILFIVALFATWWIFKKVLRIALLKNIVDNPDARKLQKIPVPVLGGVAVFFGMIVAMTITRLTFDIHSLFAIMGVMTIMLYTGTMDDILSLSPKVRFLIEILAVLLLVYTNGNSINDLHGLWGVYGIPGWIAIPFTVFACVGIINAINMIDGVNGLCSGYCVWACIAFGTAFIIADDMEAASMAILSIGALIPFICHNVFGKKSRMYLGDGGSMFMGMLLSSFVIGALNSSSSLAQNIVPEFGLVPFTLSVLTIPVFDCVRVMVTRIVRGKSPFSPDRTHLHHLFFDMGFSHVGTTALELLISIFVTAVWYLGCKLGASTELQLYIVIALGLFVTFAFYAWARIQQHKETKVFGWFQSIGKHTYVSHAPWFERFRNFLDKGC